MGYINYTLKLCRWIEPTPRNIWNFYRDFMHSHKMANNGSNRAQLVWCPPNLSVYKLVYKLYILYPAYSWMNLNWCMYLTYSYQTWSLSDVTLAGKCPCWAAPGSDILHSLMQSKPNLPGTVSQHLYNDTQIVLVVETNSYKVCAFRPRVPVRRKLFFPRGGKHHLPSL